MTFKQVVDGILNICSGFLPSTDERLTPSQIGYWVNQYRASLLPQTTDFGKEIPNECFQDLGIWSLAAVDKAETPTFAYGKTIRKFVNPLPKVVNFPFNRGLWVGSTDKQTPYIQT